MKKYLVEALETTPKGKPALLLTVFGKSFTCAADHEKMAHVAIDTALKR